MLKKKTLKRLENMVRTLYKGTALIVETDDCSI